ncbi:MAG: TonB-dependent receptor [Myxococcota bacterium]|nr:TonB-dependent receptor [Myxococcota bacterium]
MSRHNAARKCKVIFLAVLISSAAFAQSTQDAPETAAPTAEEGQSKQQDPPSTEGDQGGKENKPSEPDAPSGTPTQPDGDATTEPKTDAPSKEVPAPDDANVDDGSADATQDPASEGTPEKEDQGDVADTATPPAEEEDVEEIIIVGSRRIQDRSVIESPVAVDFLEIDTVADAVGQLDMNQLLQYVAPSFNANRQTGADGADHIDPATLRGLGPDQTLVLINGKRRHQSSLINIFGTRGRGNTGTDLNAIPIAAIERIEILRDGASAQYGSDAIAGVINIVLKEDVEKFTANVNGGFRNARPPKKYDAKRGKKIDGETLQVNGNYGIKIKDDGFLNLTMDYLTRERTNRPADPDMNFGIYRRQYGDAEGTNFNAFFNAEVPIFKHTDFYTFGGFNYRHTDAYAWSRDPDGDNNVPEIYPNGFDPHITSRIFDPSISAGVRTKLAKWTIDFDNTFGLNRFHYIIDGTLNATLGPGSPTRFDAGGHQFSQNTTGIHFTRLFEMPFDGFNVAFGAEHRIDNYQIFAGEEGSYQNYNLIETVGPDGTIIETDPLGVPAGSQGFPGFRPSNEVDESRTNIAVYVDTEVDFVEDVLMLGVAGRAEHYSDFGNTLDGKLASRWTIYNDYDRIMLAMRGSVSTGFRAPSLAQLHYNTVFTEFVSGQAVDSIIAKNNSPITRALGIPALEEEKSLNASVGFVARLAGVSLTVDGYYVNIKDRIVLTGAFEDTDPDIGLQLQALNVGRAQFFTNALDTETLGVDVILSSLFTFGQDHNLLASAALNFNHMELKDIRTHPGLEGKEDIYFGPRDQAFLLASAPGFKMNITLDYAFKMINFFVRGVIFDEVVLVDWIDEEDVYDPAFVLDVAAGWDISDNWALKVGVENLFNAYPTQQTFTDPDTGAISIETETGGLWDAVQMGIGGAFYYAKLRFTY